MKHYFKNDLAIDEDVIGVIEDSIKCNPNLTADEQNALIADICYSQPYDATADKTLSRYTFFKANYQQVTSQQEQIQSAAPDMLEALKDADQRITELCNMINNIHPRKVRAEDYAEKTRAAIAKATS